MASGETTSMVVYYLSQEAVNFEFEASKYNTQHFQFMIEKMEAQMPIRYHLCNMPFFLSKDHFQVNKQ